MRKINVYFACSIRGGGDKSNYQSIVDAINDSGAVCLSEIFVNDAIDLGGSPLPEGEIYRRDTDWIQECDAVIAEVTNPSLGVGYELAYAESIKKPVLTLFNLDSSANLSAMIKGNSYFKNSNYASLKDIKDEVLKFLRYI